VNFCPGAHGSRGGTSCGTRMSGKSGGGSRLKVIFKKIAKNSGYGGQGLKPAILKYHSSSSAAVRGSGARVRCVDRALLPPPLAVGTRVASIFSIWALARAHIIFIWATAGHRLLSSHIIHFCNSRPPLYCKSTQHAYGQLAVRGPIPQSDNSGLGPPIA
jgi:hypothetical protein